MPAMSDRRLRMVKENARTLAKRVFALNPPFQMTHHELLETFIKPEHRGPLQEVAFIVPGINKGGGFNIGLEPPLRAKVDVWVQSEGGFPLPDYVHTISPAPTEAMERLTAWANKLVTARRRWDLVMAVITELNERCDSLAQMRYLWSSIVGLLSIDPDTISIADKIRDFKMPKTFPALLPEFKQACKDADATVAMGLLLPKVVDNTVDARDAHFELRSYASLPCPWTQGVKISREYY